MARRMNDSELRRLRGEVLALCEGRSHGLAGADCEAIVGAVLDTCGWDGDCEACPLLVDPNNRDCAGMVAKLVLSADWTGYAVTDDGVVQLRYVERGRHVQQSD